MGIVRGPKIIKDPYGEAENSNIDYVKQRELRIKRKAILAKRCDTALIQGAPHNYLGYEKELSEIIGNWIATIFPE